MRVCFLYSKGQRTFGSKLMRVDQLCLIGNTYLGKHHKFRGREVPRQAAGQESLARKLRGCVIIFLKHSMSRMSDEAVKILRDGAKALIIDYIDVFPLPTHSTLYDIHLAASESGMRALQTQFRENTELRNETAKLMKVTHGDLT